jgi:hypothetical protein
MWLEGFHVKGVATGGQHSSAMLVAESGQRDDQSALAAGHASQVFCHLTAVEIGQADIEDDELGLQSPRCGQRTPAVSCIGGLVAHIEQQKKQGLRRIDIVVYDEDAPSWQGLA